SRREICSVPAELATTATPVLVLAMRPTEMGRDTDREVTVVAELTFGVKIVWPYRASTVTLPFENTFANPATRFPRLWVLMVIEPDAGIRNDTLGSTIAAGIGDPSRLKKLTMPCTAVVVDGLRTVIAVSHSPPPAACATVFTTGNICERATPPVN